MSEMPDLSITTLLTWWLVGLVLFLPYSYFASRVRRGTVGRWVNSHLMLAAIAILPWVLVEAVIFFFTVFAMILVFEKSIVIGIALVFLYLFVSTLTYMIGIYDKIPRTCQEWHGAGV